MVKSRLAPPSEPAIRVVLLPRDTNERGTIFGGIILSYIDLAGAVEARRQGNQRFVTIAMKEIVFKKPVYVGDVVSFYASTLKVGTTSITIHVDVEAQRRGDATQVQKVTEADVVYVAVDESGRPVPLNK